jgi:hypothetical protein
LQVPGVLCSVQLAIAEECPDKAEVAIAKAFEACKLALSIDASHAPTLLNLAETHVAAAKHAENHGGDSQNVGFHWAAASKQYEHVLASATASGSCSERCTWRYNWACVLSRIGKLDEACRELELVSQKDARALQGAAEDNDFANLRKLPRFGDLVKQQQ